MVQYLNCIFTQCIIHTKASGQQQDNILLRAEIEQHFRRIRQRRLVSSNRQAP